jgi:hypothetical protein
MRGMDIEVNPRSRVRKSYVRFGSEADLLRSITLVRFVPLADIAADPQQANALVGRFQRSNFRSALAVPDHRKTVDSNALSARTGPWAAEYLLIEVLHRDDGQSARCC